MELKQWLSDNQITDEEAAKGVGMSLSGFRKIKNGHRVGRPETLQRLVAFTLGEVTLADLLKPGPPVQP